MFSWCNDFIVHRFCKLGFCSVSFNATLALVGRLCKTLHYSSVGSVPISSFTIHTCWIQWHEILLLYFFSLPDRESPSVLEQHFHTTFNSTYLDNWMSNQWALRYVGILACHYLYWALSTMFSWTSDFIVHWFHKLGFFSVSFNATLTLVGQLCKTIHRSSVGSVPISAFPMHTFWSQRHEIFELHWVFLS